MSKNEARSVFEGVERLSRDDPTLRDINLFKTKYIDSELDELVDCLLAHPDVVTGMFLACNRLTDKTGVKLARYLAASSTIEYLVMANNQFSDATYLALATALRVNSSLRELHLNGNREVDRTRIEAAFVEALRLNPDRPAQSEWQLYSIYFKDIDFKRLKPAADVLGAPSMLSQLRHCDRA